MKNNKLAGMNLEAIPDVVKALEYAINEWRNSTAPGAACEGCPEPEYVRRLREALANLKGESDERERTG